MFETGVDEMSWDDLSQGRGDWPPVRALHAYRRKVGNLSTCWGWLLVLFARASPCPPEGRDLAGVFPPL